ncbi:MAG: DNA double-strand break repair nuclease NurA [Caldilineales bacterium]|nr:DNA double-strand break repair nuclease NurA [Caldilineales bacterium]
MLELHYLLEEADSMSREMMVQRQTYADLAERAHKALGRFAVVDDELLDKIDRAATEDLSWRGALPLGSRLDEIHEPIGPAQDASLIGVDGSQIYPDPHGFAFYYLVNTGSVMLRQGSGQAPVTFTRPNVYYRQHEIYDENQQLVDNRAVNAAREMAELIELTRVAELERMYWGGDLERLVVALNDGPLLIWIGEKEFDDQKVRQRTNEYIDQLATIQTSGAIPIGYVDRPRSANIIRLLHVADLDLMHINQETIRSNRYRGLTDQELFSRLLAPNQRTGLFASTARLNYRPSESKRNALDGIFEERGQQIQFFYMNVSDDPDPANARVVRVDVPAWAAGDATLLDQVQQAIYSDCEGTGYPYVLIRAHELALVSHSERRDFEQMLRIAMLRQGLLSDYSQKALLKQLF